MSLLRSRSRGRLNWLNRRSPTICHSSDGCRRDPRRGRRARPGGRLGGGVGAHAPLRARPCRRPARRCGRSTRRFGGPSPSSGSGSGARTSARPRPRSPPRRTRSPRRRPCRRADEHAPGHPAVRERPEQRAVAVGDHGEGEAVLLLPGAAGLLGLDRPDVDDLQPVACKPLVEPDDGRTLLPTALSGRLPEDEQHPVRPLTGRPRSATDTALPGAIPPESPSTTFTRLRPSSRRAPAPARLRDILRPVDREAGALGRSGRSLALEHAIRHPLGNRRSAARRSAHGAARLPVCPHNPVVGGPFAPTVLPA